MKFSFILLLLMALVSWPVMAEDAETPQTKKVLSEQQIEEDRKNTKTQTKSKKRPSERKFDPSETISEDLSVPFPVDI